MPTIADVRAKYPQYKDLSDDQLAQGMHRKFYSDMPFEEFAKRIQYSPAIPAPDVNALDVGGSMVAQAAQGTGEVAKSLSRTAGPDQGVLSTAAGQLYGMAGDFLTKRSADVREFAGQAASAITSAVGFGDETAEDVYRRTSADTPEMERSRKENVITGDITSPSTVSLGTNPTMIGMATNIGDTAARMAPVIVGARINPLLGVTAGGMQDYEGARTEESDRIGNLPREQIVAMPRFRELVAEETGKPFEEGYADISAASSRLFDGPGTDEDEAIAAAGARALQRLKDEAGHASGLWSVPLGMAQGLIFTGKIGKAISTGVRGSSTGVVGAARAAAGTATGMTAAALGEAATEVGQKVSSAYGSTLATGEQGRNLTEDTAADAILGGAMGAGTNVSLPKPKVIDKVFGGEGIKAGDVLGEVGDEDAPAPGPPPTPGPMPPRARAGYTFDENGNIIEQGGGLVPVGPSPVAPESPGYGMGPLGPLQSDAANPDFMVDPQGSASAPGDWRAREQARRAQSGGPGMGPAVNGDPTMPEADMAQAAFDSSIEAMQLAIGRKPTKASMSATAATIATRFGVDPAALIARHAQKPAASVEPVTTPPNPASVAVPVPVVPPTVRTVGVHPNAPQEAPAPVPTGKMWRRGKSALAVQTADGTWFVRVKRGTQWQAWQKRETFDPSGAFGYSPYTPPSGNVRINGKVHAVGERRSEAKQAKAPPDVIDSIIAAGGLNREEMRKHGIDPRMFGTRRGATKWVFPRNGGMTLDALRQRLIDDGYFPPEDPDAPPTISNDDAFEIVQRALNQGERIVSTTHAGAEAAYQEARNAIEAGSIDAMDAEAASDYLSRIEGDEIARGVFDQLDPDEDVEGMSLNELVERALAAGVTPQEMRKAYDLYGFDGEPTAEPVAARNLWELIRTKEKDNGAITRTRSADRGNGPAPAPQGPATVGNAAQRPETNGNEGGTVGRDQPEGGDAAREQAGVERRTGSDRSAVDALPANERDAEIQRLRAENAELQRQLDTDPLTGVLSRAAYERDIQNARGVATIDLKQFKGYNTVGGQTGGDLVLKAFAKAMKDAESDGVRAYRPGGDEFAFLSADNEQSARDAADRLQQFAADIRLSLGKDGVTYSIEGVPFTAGIGHDAESADTNLSANKGDYDRNALPESIRRTDQGDVGSGNEAAGDGRNAAERDVQGPADPLTLTDNTVVTPPRAQRPASQSGLFGPVTDIDRQRLRFERDKPKPEKTDTVDIEDAINQTPPTGGVSVSTPTEGDRNAQKPDVDTSAARNAEADGQANPASSAQADAGADNGAPPADAAGRVSGNTVFTDDAAEQARARLRARLGRSSSGLDPQMVQDGITLAGWHIEKGARSFAAFAKAMLDDLGGAVRPYLKSWYMAAKYDPRLSQFAAEMSTAADVESANADVIGGDDVPGTDRDLERNREDAGGSASTVETAVQPSERKPAAGTGEAGEVAATGQARRPRRPRVPADGTAADGESSDLDLFGGATVDQPTLVPAGADIDQRGGGLGDGGIPVEPAAATKPADPAERVVPELSKRTAQHAAERVAVKVGDLENVRATLPYLLPGQQEDVHKAETRFAKPDGYGMLFTNGTGTGKTFSGLGIVKRFARQGKTNTLIVAPSDKIIEDWIDSAKALGLTVTRLTGTNEAGTGIVITTYAAFGANRTLADRSWDLVVTDEAHYLAQAADGEATTFLRTLRAITMHPEGDLTRAYMIHRELIDRRDAMRSDLGKLPATPALEALDREIDEKRKAMTATVKASQGDKRPRAVFLSATPFAYEKAIDWANGYLFDYNEGQGKDNDGAAYNSGDNRERFFMQSFGYRMRYNKLTQPDANVDSGVMQRQFNTLLKRSGSLSSRILDVAADYDRKFILAESAIGTRIDAALQWVHDQRGDAAHEFARAISKRFDHLSRRFLLEAIKADEVMPHIREHMARGRKVVVFHDYKKGGGFNPFDIPHMGDDYTEDQARGMGGAKAGDYNALVDEFRAEFRDLVNYPFASMPSPINAFRREFPGLLLFNGDVSPKDRRAAVAKFNDDASGPQIILVQSAAGKEGISLHDTTGKHQRVLFNLGLPTQPTTAIQQEGRIYRTGQVTDALFRYLNTGTNWERWAFATTIATRSSTAENLALGEQARALRDAFISGFEESSDYRAGDENEGKGGKERDRAANEALTEFDRARAFYFGTQKKNSRTKAQEGTDYFATPEPLGLKMVEWADIRPGETALEPSAGHGAIARWFPETNQVTVIEPSNELSARLAMVRSGQGTRMVSSKFEDHDVVNKYDVIVMNPPFGSGGRTAIDHLDKAARHLRDGGRIVALIPTGPAADAKFQKWFFDTTERPINPLVTHPVHGPIYKGDTITTKYMPGDLVVALSDGPQYVHADKGSVRTLFPLDQVTSVKPTGKRVRVMAGAAGLHLTADIELPAVTFERAGTQVRTRILVIDKIDGTANPGQSSRDYTDATTIKDFFDRIEHSSIPSRMKARPAEEAAPEPTPAAARGAAKSDAKAAKQAAAAAGEQAAAAAGEPIVEHVTQNGKTLRGVVRSISQVEAKALDAYTFRKNGGFFIRLENLDPDKADNPPPGWEFAEPAERLSDEVIEREVAKARAAFPGFTITVLDSIQDSPASAATKAKYPGANGLTDGVSRVWIFRNAQSLQALRMTLAHEITGHIGVESVIGSDWPAVQAEIERIRKGASMVSPALANAVKAAVSRYPKADPLTFARESVAIMAETGVTGSLWDRIVAAVRKYLRKVFGSLQWNENEIRDLLRRAGDSVRSKPAVFRGAEFEAASVGAEGVETDELASNPAPGPIERQMHENARAGQPIDKIFRAIPQALGLLDSHGRLKIGTKAFDALVRVIAEKLPAEDGAFGWAIPYITAARAGLIDRYGVPSEFVKRDEQRQSEVRAVLMHAARVANDLEGLTTAEAKVLQAMLTGHEIPAGELGKLSQPIKEAIDQMGREAVEMGLISPEAYARNRGAYLHRSYLKYEADRSKLGKFIGNLMDKRRKKLMGDTLRGRGMTMDRDAESVARALGGEVKEGDIVTVLRQKTETGVRTKYQRGPLNGAPPVGWESLGDWRAMGVKGKKATLWRDFTPEEREKMGEILDARYNIVKTFSLMSHDLATGKFLRDIAANPEWATKELPEGASFAEAGGRYETYSDRDWVRVPDAVIPGTNDGKGKPVKRWGALAGMYVRAPIWRDLNQLQEMQNPQLWSSTWKEVLRIWKMNKTARNPVVHMNNVMSNLMFMDLADIRLRDLYAGIGAYRRGEKDADYRDAMAHGAFGGGFADQELKRKVLDPILDKILREQKQDQADTVEGRAQIMVMLGQLWDLVKRADGRMLDAYGAEDEIFRLAFYLRRQSLGDTPEEAARAARRQFIDYDIRAPWVNMARNTLLPFIGYTYRSIPLLAQAIAERPWKLAKYATLAAAANWFGYWFWDEEDDEETDRKVMAPQVQGTTWVGSPRMIRMPWHDGDGNPVFLDVRRWIPAGDVFDTNQSEMGMPAWLQFGGPLMLAGEYVLNKQAFTRKPIVDPLTDTTTEKAGKTVSWAWKAFMPNAPWIPESYSWDKLQQAATGATDDLGRDYSALEASASVLGIKAAGHDVDLQRRYRAMDFDRHERELDFEISALKREMSKKAISRERFDANLAKIIAKKKLLNDERRRVLSR